MYTKSVDVYTVEDLWRMEKLLMKAGEPIIWGQSRIKI